MLIREKRWWLYREKSQGVDRGVLQTISIVIVSYIGAALPVHLNEKATKIFEKIWTWLT